MRLKAIPLSVITTTVTAIASFPLLITNVLATSKQVETPISPFGTIPITSPVASGGWMNSRLNAPDNSDRKQGVASLTALERTV